MDKNAESLLLDATVTALSIGVYKDWPIRFDDSYGTYYIHQGGAFGTQNYLFIFPEKDLGVSVFLNQNISGTTNRLRKVVTDIMEDLK